uniref:Uracil-DNA glycosylase-like domain-containing protein n=1 Tax=viral metagenome TaxID=1070528 RepID=A0A6C0J166_9ZZZZ
MSLIYEINNLQTNWKDWFLNYSKEICEIDKKLSEEKPLYNTLSIFPKQEHIFRCFNYFNIKNTKVVIIGQDCYHGKNQANGLCFSVDNEIKNPPSLRNILKELNSDLEIKRTSSDFTDLGQQGILFLNCSLTVLEKSPLSHMEYWYKLTNQVIEKISSDNENIVFVLWGNFAKNKKKYIDTKKHFILEATHPSPLSANRGEFFGCKHFSKINELLL